MVCLVDSVLKNEPVQKEKNGIHKMSDEVIYDEEFDDDYSLVTLAGGSIVNHAPLFTANGKYLLIISGYKMFVYSTTTGELIRDLEEFGKSDIVAAEFSLNDPKVLIGCSIKGEVVFWDWKNGNIRNRLQLPVRGTIKTFTLLNIVNGLCALITYRDESDRIPFNIINLEKNLILNCPLELELNNEKDRVMTVAENQYFYYFAIVQGHSLLIVDYKSWRSKMWKNANKVDITVLKAHPSEMLIATGDEMGKVFLWRNFLKGEIYKALYHWHHTPVTSVAFTLSGSTFYSGGHESVLVKWNINQPNLKEFLPRMDGYICHITVGDENKKVAVSTAENSIKILDDQNQQKCVLQNFTFVYDNKCNQDKFPVGLKLNPVNNTLVLNGRFGHLQFYSTYTKSLLYNVDIVMQNKLSMESRKILYDIIVIKADFNVHWMATADLWDDQEHLPELNLKFWEYKNENQSYSLNTSIALPHEGGIKSIKFSNTHKSSNLLCATLGNDSFIKIWSLEQSNNIHKKRKIWLCIAKTKYKHFEATSMDFSVDGSLLAVGYGNTLCVFKSDTLKLKAVLTAPPLYDGSLQKIQICMNEEKLKGLVVDNTNHKKILEIFKNFEENVADKNIVKILQKSSTNIKSKITVSSLLSHNKNCDILFKKILGISELNLFQKLLVYQKLNMNFSVPSSVQLKMIKYLNLKFDKEAKEKYVRNYTNLISDKDRFKAKYRLRKYYSRKNLYQNKINEILTPLLDLLKIEDQTEDVEMKAVNANCNGFGNGTLKNGKDEVQRKKVNKILQNEDVPYNIQGISAIKTVNFGKGEYAHLIIITTEHRIILWNILTLRIHFVLKLSVKQMIVDDITSLCAAITTNNELYVFLPNAPLDVYRRNEMPEILSACWVPRKQPKPTSLNLDWQSLSTLYFLSEKQELIYLSSNKDDESKDIITFVNNPNEIIRPSIFDVHLLNKGNKKSLAQTKESFDKIGVPGKAEIASVMLMSSHASAPMNLLCSNFIKSLLSTNESQTITNEEETSSVTVRKADNDSDGSTDEIYSKIKEKKKVFSQSLEPISRNKQTKDFNKLQKILQENLTNDIHF